MAAAYLKKNCVLEAGVTLALINTYFLLQFSGIKHTLYLYIVLCIASLMIHFHKTISELINYNIHMAELTTPYNNTWHSKSLSVRSIIPVNHIQSKSSIESSPKLKLENKNSSSALAMTRPRNANLTKLLNVVRLFSLSCTRFQ